MVGTRRFCLDHKKENSLLQSMAGDAVLIAPVSEQIPANRELYREIGDFGRSETWQVFRSRGNEAVLRVIPCFN